MTTATTAAIATIAAIRRPSAPARAGSVLIMIAGLSALMASLALAFLLTTRSDIEEMEGLTREIQARIMLSAACSYIQEASRLGYDPDSTSGGSGGTPVREHTEAHGWIDVRDGSLGPRATTGLITPGMRNVTPLRPLDPGGQGAANFPIGVPRRFPMYAMQRPPFAIAQKTSYNPVQTTSPDSGRAYLRYPDPQPAISNGWVQDPANPAGSVTAANFADWEQGNPAPRPESFGRSWFRIVREPTGAVFTVTCGAGGSQGYRTWAEVAADNATQLFNGSAALFEELASDETRFWYRVEWSPAITAVDMNYLREFQEDTFMLAGVAYSGGGVDHSAGGYSGQFMAANMGGTIQWIQRLRSEPAVW
jgi:hypothetical protein